MRFLLRQKRIFSVILLTSFSSFVVSFSPVQAKLIPTAQVLNEGPVDPARARLKAFLEREDVQNQLEAWGLNKEEAKSSVDNLTDEEVARAAQRLEQLPAGGGAVGALIGAAVLIFLVLLLTDILGYTDVFHFVKKHH